MAETIHRHTCAVCNKEFFSPRKARVTCGRSCLGKLAGNSPSKLICSCGKPASKKGYCFECSLERKRLSRRLQYAKHRKKILEKRHIQYVESSEVRANMNLFNTKKRFNGLRLDRLRLDRFTCQSCGSKNNLVVHHKEKVAGKDRKDTVSSIDNLLTLCRRCHVNHHRALGDLGKGGRKSKAQQSRQRVSSP